MAVMGYLVLLVVVALGGSEAFLHNRIKGDPCVLQGGVQGVCTGIRSCRGEAVRIRMSGSKIVHCSYDHDGPIICCRTAMSHTNQPMMLNMRVEEDTESVPATLPLQSNNSTEIAMKKCAEYGEYAYVIRELETLLPVAEFERELRCAIIAEELVVGGMRAERNEFAHMAALGYVAKDEVEWSCAGSLISESFVLTAAHCTTNSERIKVSLVRLGTLNIRTPGKDFFPQTIPVEERMRHPMYKNPAKYHDIALLKLAWPAKLGLDVRPACLYTEPGNPPAHKFAIATGWGITESYTMNNSDILMKVRLELFPNKQCETTHKQDDLQLAAGFVNSTMLCAGDPAGMNDTCMGDSGGPLQIRLKEPKCMHSIVGVTSFGSSNCVSSEQPGVYTRVSYFVPWIQSIVWP